MRVLLVEDDALIGKGIVAGLRRHGIVVRQAGTAQDAETIHARKKASTPWYSIWAFPTATAWRCWRACAPWSRSCRF